MEWDFFSITYFVCAGLVSILFFIYALKETKKRREERLKKFNERYERNDIK